MKKRKRVGRGPAAGCGKTSGRGTKGQKSRSGSKTRAWFEGGQMPLIRRIPKRGFKNRNRKEYQVVNLKDLNNLKVKKIDKKRPLKILGDGEIKKPITVEADAFSKSAKENIEASGGKVILSGTKNLTHRVIARSKATKQS